jgi:hypothetical protein
MFQIQFSPFSIEPCRKGVEAISVVASKTRKMALLKRAVNFYRRCQMLPGRLGEFVSEST